MRKDHGVVRGESLELVRRGFERKLRDRGDARRNHFSESLRRVEAGADGRAALGELHQGGQRRFDARDAIVDLLGVTREFLAERQRRRVLRVRAADLDDVRPGLRLVVQRLVQFPQRGKQAVHDFLRAGDVHRRRIRIVRRLAHVDVIVRMDRLFRAHLAAKHLDGAVRDDFVGIHVRLRAGARLPDDEREMVVELAVHDFLSCLDDGVADLRIEPAERHVRFGGRALDDAERPDDRRGLSFPTDLEIAEAALGLRAPISVDGNFDRAEGIGLGSGLGHLRSVPVMVREILCFVAHGGGFVEVFSTNVIPAEAADPSRLKLSQPS